MNNNGHRDEKKIKRLLGIIADLILQNHTIAEIEAAQKEALEAGATDEEISETVWNARRIAQGRLP